MSRHKERYGGTFGNPQGFRPRLNKCAAEVTDKYTHITRQCSFYKGYGPGGDYCKIHARKIK